MHGMIPRNVFYFNTQAYSDSLGHLGQGINLILSATYGCANLIDFSCPRLMGGAHEEGRIGWKLPVLYADLWLILIEPVYQEAGLADSLT